METWMIPVFCLGLAMPAWSLEPVPGRAAIELPEAKAFTADRKPLLETDHVKLMALRIKAGQILERHSAPQPAIIKAISGSGVVRYDDGRTDKLDARNVVVLSPDVPHAVIPDQGQEMVLLIELVKGAPAGQTPHHHD